MNKWDLSYFFANDEEFEKALEGLNDYLPKLASYKGQLSDETKLKEYLLLSDELETKLYKVYQYAHLKSDLNKKDVENAAKVSKVMMPVLVVLSLGVAVYVCVSNGIRGEWEGILYYIKPDFSKFSIMTVVAALGQLFYSMSLA